MAGRLFDASKKTELELDHPELQHKWCLIQRNPLSALPLDVAVPHFRAYSSGKEKTAFAHFVHLRPVVGHFMNFIVKVEVIAQPL